MEVLSPKVSEYQHIQEFERLLDLFVELKPKRILEIGSLMGSTLEHWIKLSPNGSDIISIDLPVREFIGAHDSRVKEQEFNYENIWPTWTKENRKLHQIHLSSHNSYAKLRVQMVTPELDFIFIDGDHSYEGIQTDYLMYGPMVKKGIIAFHDIGKNEAGDGFKFWSQIKRDQKYEEILLDANSEKGIGVLFINM